jgi:hypothetical protein
MTLIGPGGDHHTIRAARDAEQAARQPEALLFTMAGDAHERDADALRAFRERLRGTDRVSAVNVIGVLTKIDALSGEPDPWPRAVEKAKRIRAALGPLVAGVVPVIGLLAESADTGALNEDHAEWLRTVAELAPGDGDDSPAGVARTLLEHDASVPRSQREELFDLLHPFGVSAAFELARAGRLNGVELVRRMRELSGIVTLRAHLDGFGQRADALKADAALTRLEQLSWLDRRLRFIQARVDEVRLEPGMHALELLRALDLCARRNVALPEEMLQELERLVTGRSLTSRLGLDEYAATSVLVQTADERRREWTAFRNDRAGSVAERNIAAIVVRAYGIMQDQAALTG